MSIFADVYLDCKAVPQRFLFTLLTNRGVHALVFYRLARILHLSRVPLLPLLLTRVVQIVYGIDISYKASISPGVLIVHGIGLVIGNGVVICSGVKIYHGVTLGIADNGRENDGFPTICSGVTIGAGACVLGRVKVGENSFVGANAVVLKDVPRDSIAVGNPLRVLERTR